MEADVQEHRCEYHIQRDVGGRAEVTGERSPAGEFFKNGREGFLQAKASLKSYCLGAETLQMHPQHWLYLSALLWFSQREMHNPGTKGAHIVFPFLSGNFPQMDNERKDCLTVSAPSLMWAVNICLSASRHLLHLFFCN